jgi:hypothetical protein
MHLLRRTKPFLDGPCGRRPIGLGSLALGLGVSRFSFPTVKWSYASTGRSLWTFSELRQRIRLLPSRLMCMYETSTPRNLFTLVIGTSSTSLSSLKCFHLLHRLLLVEISAWRHLNLSLQGATRSVRTFLVAIGALARVRARCARIAGSMASAAFVAKDIEQKTASRASLSSKVAIEWELLEAREKVAAFVEEGPRSYSSSSPSLKRKSTDIPDAPRYRRGFVWSDSSNNKISPSALYTESAPPLPSPPQHLLDDPAVQASLRSLGDSIKVETPFDVDKFELLLHDHPNRPFVQSVMKGLREGFWPFDEGEWKVELEEVTPNYDSDLEDAEAIRAFRDQEVAAERWSDPLASTELLPGMKISPMFVVWQNEKPRVITDHSRSGINDGIPRAEAKVRYDDMRTFGQTLHDARAANPGKRLVTFKSDVSSAFLNLPAHPIFQLRQVVKIEGKLYIVRRLTFGNRASPRCWCAVSGLLCWLGIRKLKIDGLHVYMDDFFGWDYADDLVWYRGRLRPRRQVQLLVLWESISCPFEDRKQDHGEVLKIIGLWVDVNAGSISLPPAAILNIVAKIDLFLATTGRSPSLRSWQRLAGHLNWMLNVLPWGRPALTELYRKISGKNWSHCGIPINAAVIVDLSWLRDVIPSAIGIRFTDVGLWSDCDADMVIWTDASLRNALAFVYSNKGFLYPIKAPPEGKKVDIFFLELMAIASAVHHAGSLPQPPRRVLVWTDSLDSVAVLNSLHTTESVHNAPLLAIAEVIIQTGMDLRVRFIEGKMNVRADMLSRLLIDEYQSKFPADRVHRFAPPRELLPARWRECF